MTCGSTGERGFTAVSRNLMSWKLMNSSRIALYIVKVKQRFRGIRSKSALPIILPRRLNLLDHLLTRVDSGSIMNATSSVSHLLNKPSSGDSKCFMRVVIHSRSIPPASVDNSPIKVIFHSYAMEAISTLWKFTRSFDSSICNREFSKILSRSI